LGVIRETEPVKLVCGAIGVDREAVTAAEAAMSARYGAIDLESDWIPFEFTDYYEPEMGSGLVRRFFSFAELIDPAGLPGAKRLADEIEKQHAVVRNGVRCRRVNLDPGYVAPSKLVLASTKDFSHRIYLGGGIYAEVTLNFHRDGLTFFEWTFPDFRSGAYTPFLLEVRRRLMRRAGHLPRPA